MKSNKLNEKSLKKNNNFGNKNFSLFTTATTTNINSLFLPPIVVYKFLFLFFSFYNHQQFLFLYIFENIIKQMAASDTQSTSDETTPLVGSDESRYIPKDQIEYEFGGPIGALGMMIGFLF